MPKKTRKPEPQTPSLALNTSAAKPTTTARRPSAEPRTPAGEVTSPEASGVKATENPAPALPDADAMAHEIYRLALEQKDCATLLRLAEVLYPEKFVEPREGAKVRKVASP
jgi:hypothetical protein